MARLMYLGTKGNPVCLINDKMKQIAMSLEFADVKTAPLKPKATVHRSGKIGFNSDAADFMGLKGDEEFCVAYDQEQGPHGNLYLLPPGPDKPDESCIQVAKAGEYFHLNLRRFFERYGIEYETYKFIYDVKEREGEGYLLRKRDDVKKRV